MDYAKLLTPFRDSWMGFFTPEGDIVPYQN